ncbi:MAG: hypothetical protein RIB97_13110 [Nitratireductor sp.]
MDSNIIQKRVNDLVSAMMAKGMREPHAQVDIRANQEPHVFIRWKSGINRGVLGDDKYQFFEGDIGAGLSEASAFVAEQPEPKQQKLNDFMAALGSVIDLGRKHGIDAEYLNPLTASMKKLSENVITDQRAA